MVATPTSRTLGGLIDVSASADRQQRLWELHLGLRAINVASSELLNVGLLDYVNERADTVYLSTGLADLEEVSTAVVRLSNVRDLVVMHCVTQYSLADQDANLRAIVTLARAFPERRVGYSTTGSAGSRRCSPWHSARR